MRNQKQEQKINHHFGVACIYPKGMMIVLEGDQCELVGMIIKGSVKLNHFNIEGEETITAHLNENDLFGHLLIHAKNPRFPGNLVTLEETSIAYISKEQINELLISSNEFREFYLSHVCEKAMELNMQNKLLRQLTLRSKIIFWLELQQQNQLTKRISLPTQTSLAKVFNVQRPSLSRELNKLKQEKIIDFNRKHIWIIRDNNAE